MEIAAWGNTQPAMRVPFYIIFPPSGVVMTLKKAISEKQRISRPPPQHSFPGTHCLLDHYSTCMQTIPKQASRSRSYQALYWPKTPRHCHHHYALIPCGGLPTSGPPPRTESLAIPRKSSLSAFSFPASMQCWIGVSPRRQGRDNTCDPGLNLCHRCVREVTCVGVVRGLGFAESWGGGATNWHVFKGGMTRLGAHHILKGGCRDFVW